MASVKFSIPFVEISFDEQDFKRITDLITSVKVEGCCYIIAKHSGKSLDVQDWSKENAANVFQFDFHGGGNQQWIFLRNSEKNSEEYYYIFNKHSGKCLDIENASMDNCSNLQQYTFHGGSNQQWKLIKKGKYYQIMARHSGKVLDVSGYSYDNCANVYQFASHNGENQLWRIQSVNAKS